MRLIQPNCRFLLKPGDLACLLDILGREYERGLEDVQAVEALLDETDLYEALIGDGNHLQLSLELYFYILVRHILQRHGIEERETADYAASVLADFATSGLKRRSTHGRNPFGAVVDRMIEAAESQGPDRLFLTVRIADRMLVLTGVFAEHVEYRRKRHSAPGLDYYEAFGSSHYAQAGHSRLAHELEMAPLYQDFSQRFSQIREGLNELTDRLLFLEKPPPADLFGLS